MRKNGVETNELRLGFKKRTSNNQFFAARNRFEEPARRRLFEGRVQNGCETLAGPGELTFDVGLDGGDIGLTYGLMFVQKFGRRSSVRTGGYRGSCPGRGDARMQFCIWIGPGDGVGLVGPGDEIG